jgi:hypothetical protein
MIGRLTLRILFGALVALVLCSQTQAQPLLPDIIGASQKGLNILSWTAQYDGIKSIAVQRSKDSVYNFTTIGYVKNLKKGPQGFIDGHPNPGTNWYRLYIAFSSDLTWYSNRFKIVVDSQQLLESTVMLPNDSLQKLVPKATMAMANVRIDSATGRLTAPIKIAPIVTTPAPELVKSEFVFTNPFTGHVNIELPEIRQHHYSLKFFDSRNQQVLEITRLLESPVIVDKRNFQRKGLYKFELYRDREKWESGYVNIF